LWDRPLEYLPQRFISPEGNFKSPPHFLPFSVGRRSCIGYRIVQMVSTMVVASLLR
jgi:cytochrome P450 family 307 subfamily A